MLILSVKTDQPIAEVGIYENNQQLGYKKWEAHRQLSSTLLKRIDELLKDAGKDWGDVKGVIFFKGPGSFTGLRIGASAVNAIAFNENRSVVGANGNKWIEDGIDKLLAGVNEITVIPEYGSEPRTTKPKK